MNTSPVRTILPLSQLRLTNFRGFASATIDLDDRVTVFFGGNAAGKTSVLDALAIGMGPVLARIPLAKARRLVHGTDLRFVRDPSTQSPQSQLFGFARANDASSDDAGDIFHCTHARIDVTALGDLSWGSAIYRSKADLPSGAPDLGKRLLNAVIDEQIRQVLDRPSAQDGAALPMVAFYGNARAVVDVPLRDRSRQRADAMHERLRAYDDALTATTNFRTVFEWFRVMEQEEQAGKIAHRDFDYRLPALEWVRAALSAALPRLRNPRVVTKPIRMLVDFQLPDGTWQPLDVRMLSDGFRTHFALVADIARRMVQLNPCDDLTTRERATWSPALVLIDEVDLHLDPPWQSRVVAGLLSAFPRAQFVVTTHSEQVIGSVQANQVRKLAWNGDEIECLPVAFAQGASAERILMELMGADERVEGEVTRLLRDYVEMVDQGHGRSDAAQTLRARLDVLLPDDERLYQADLEMNRQELMASLGSAMK